MKKMKILFLMAVLAVNMNSTAHAQENGTLDRIHIGLIGGYHSTSTKFSDLNSGIFDDPKSVGGAVFGAFAEFEFGQSRMFSIRPQVSFLSRGTKLEDINYQQGTGIGQLDYTLKAKYTDIRLPLMLNFGRPDGIRPYIYVAPIVGFASGGDITVEDKANKYTVDVSKANMASTYLAVAPGVGVKIPLGSLQLGLEASYELGLTDTYGSKEKDGKALSNLFFPVYKIEGTRKFTGLEVAAHLSVPLSVFKAKPRSERVVETVYVERPAEQKITVKRKPCYTLEEILDLIASNQNVEGLTICAIDLINFEYDRSTLTRDSRQYIDKIINLMKQTGIEMEVKGHTDDRGTDEYNMNLSKQRAEAVYNYMIQHGVSRSKLSYSYYGKTQPIESNDTDEGRRQNRRVEFEIK